MTAWRQQIDNSIVHSTIATRYPNGSDELRAHLAPIHDPRAPAKTVGLLIPTAAAAWDAMAAHALREGVLLLPTSSVDTFRPLRTQQAIFADRYRTTNQGNGSRVCNGKRWYLRKGKATAACPGTSNHGRGEAIDVGNCTGSRLAWLETHARTYGWAWELASEPWHLHYMLGDRLPAGVTAASAGDPTPFLQEDDDMPLHLIQCDPKRDEWPEIKTAVFKTGGLRSNTEWVCSGGHADALKQLGLVEGAIQAVSPNLLIELIPDEFYEHLAGFPKPTKKTHPKLSSPLLPAG